MPARDGPYYLMNDLNFAPVIMKEDYLSKNYFTPSDVAELLMVSPVTVRLWSQRGELGSVITPGGHRRYLQEHIETFAKEKNIPINLNKTSGLRVLIVDDDTQFAYYLDEFLQDQDEIEKTAVAHDGFRAGLLIYTFNPQIILLDIRMPYVDGISVCHDLKKGPLTKEIRVIAMTGYYSKETVEKIMDAGAEACLRKPFEQEELLEVMGLSVEEKSN